MTILHGFMNGLCSYYSVLPSAKAEPDLVYWPHTRIAHTPRWLASSWTCTKKAFPSNSYQSNGSTCIYKPNTVYATVVDTYTLHSWYVTLSYLSPCTPFQSMLLGWEATISTHWNKHIVSRQKLLCWTLLYFNIQWASANSFNLQWASANSFNIQWAFANSKFKTSELS